MARNLRHSGQPSETCAADGPPGRLGSAVVLDTSPLWAQLVERVLARIGISIIATPHDPRDALAVVAEHQPDLLVVALGGGGPAADGIELVRRACKVDPDLEVIVLSRLADSIVIDAALAAGAAAYIVKTERPSELRLAFRQAVHHSLSLASTAVGVDAGAADAVTVDGALHTSPQTQSEPRSTRRAKSSPTYPPAAR